MRWIMRWEAGELACEAPPHAAAQGILLAVTLSSVFWLGLAVSVRILW
jgi:hypothetical protein